MGMAITHALAAGMGGVRTAGDLVARTQICRGMRLKEAKEYVASRLRVSVADLSDEAIMDEVRDDFDIGKIRAFGGKAKGIQAKIRIADLLDIEINCVEKFRRLTS